jgi:hypothetical protein
MNRREYCRAMSEKNVEVVGDDSAPNQGRRGIDTGTLPGIRWTLSLSLVPVKGGFTLRKRLLLATGLVIALLVPTVAFGATINFHGSFPNDSNATISFHVKRTNGKNKKVLDLSVRHFNVNCTVSGPTEIQTAHPLAINAAVQHRKWHYNNGTTNFQGKFRKHNKDKADGTLEVTLTGIDFGQGNGPENCHGGPQAWHAHH